MKTPITIKGAIFDMDGTLLESLFFWGNFWRDFGKKYFDDDDFQPDISLEKRLRTTMYPETLRILAEKYRISDEHFFDDQFQYLEDFYRYKVSAKQGASELLSSLKQQGIPICVASASGVKYVDVALCAVGLREYVDFLHSCDEVGAGKDRPDVFLKAADSMGLSPSDVCVFEDSFLALETARTAGFHTVGVYDQYSYEQERLCAASEIYLGKGKTLFDVIGQIEF